MKRFLHALAALWPKKRATGSPPDPDTGSGIQVHLDAVLRMERALSGFADLPIHEFAEDALSAGALSAVRDQLPESTDTRLNESTDTRLNESPDTRLNESTTRQLKSSAQQLTESPDTRLNESPDTRLNESPDTRLIESPDTRLTESPNQPQSLPRKPQPMPLLTILMLVFFMCLMAAKSRAFGTAAFLDSIPESAIRPLQIGDTIPEELWHLPLQVVNHPEGKETITLNDYRGKLIILDFWATWCAPCILALHRLDELQGQFRDELTAMPVTYESPHKVRPFFKEKGWKLPTITSDSILKRFFPHGMIPHQIWIKENTLRGITSHTDATFENVIKISTDQEYIIQSKADILDYSIMNPLNKYAEQADADILYSSVLTKQIKGLPSRMDRAEVGNFHIINYVNTSIISMYQRTLGVDFNKIIVEVNDQDKVSDSKLNTNVFSYQLKVTKEIPAHSIKRHVLHDLNNHFNYTLARKMLERDCFIIVEIDEPVMMTDFKIPFQMSEDKLTTHELDAFVDLLNSSSVWRQDLPIYINGSDFNGKISVPNYKLLQKDLNTLRSTLIQYGLQIRMEKRPIIMYVLSDKFNRKLFID